MDENRILNERISNASEFMKKHAASLSAVLLAAIVWLAVFIRTRNLAGLRDVSTGGWTLGPDLDPFLFLRWAKHIVATGSLYAVDTLRNVPLGYQTNGEFILLPYLMAWFHSIASFFGSTSVEHSAVLFPVVMFALTVVSFFLFVRKIFVEKVGKTNATYIALIASFFLSVIPALLPRTIAGIPEKESAAFFFMFLAFYFFLEAWSAQKRTPMIVHSILAGIATAGIGLVWGGVLYVFVTISIAAVIAFVLNQIEGRKQLIVPIWFITTLVLVMPFSTRYSLRNIIMSESTSIPLAVCFLLLVNFIIFNTRLKDKLARFEKIPPRFFTIIASFVLLIVLLGLVQGPGALFDRIGALINRLINPFTQTRFNITVAENRMPFFGEWAGSFGPYIAGIPVFFWLFFFGSIYLFWNLASVFEKKARRYLTLSYTIFLFALIFSRFKEASVLNGENFVSNLIYFSGMLILGGTFLYWYVAYYKKGSISELKSMDFGLILLFSLFFLSVVSARGGIRLIMMLVPPVSIIVAYLLVNLGTSAQKRDDSWKTATWIFFALVVLGSIFAAVQFTQVSVATAKSYIPSSYTQQWQESMGWVRENTPANSVFAHWWDYGYWVQSMGERATILDGGNNIVYWNHLLGRYVLTGPSEAEALSFLYAHNATHLLIDSSDIGKYPAFSSIGSNENYDRYSWMNSYVKDRTRTQELKNSTLYLYTGGFIFDDDLVFNQNGTQIFLPGLRSGIGGVFVEISKSGAIRQPEAVAVYQNRQYRLPIRYVFDGNELVDFGTGLDAGIAFIPSLEQDAAGLSVDPFGSLIYLSNKTVRSGLARYYLYGEETAAVKLVHSQDDPIVAQIKQMGAADSDFIYYGGVRGPIKIWEITYPRNMAFNASYLETTFPDARLEQVDR